ncbi:PAS domain-containing sensor histidine kinase [Desulfosarcina alkanivorans]|uniref:histidine kinase n=2 Tax=Desulfosarcina alkanivorans TaxID=571177 RepID=A0A5K7YNW8_9BACT|nr:PAS domain-containing sensor histidine kinase [Desulfosarcina alkanivorans]
MISKTSHRSRTSLHTSPWIIIGSVSILLIVVVVLAYQNYSREKKYMSRILSEKGAAIIKAVEAGARTGMMGMMWGGQQVQTLLEETARLPDVFYISVVNSNGLVLASSNRGLIGTQMSGGLPEKGLNQPEATNWRYKRIDDQRNAFEVYRSFRPVSHRDTWMGDRMRHMMRGRGMMMGPDNDWFLPSASGDSDQIILVGLDPQPFEEGRKEDIRNTAIISGVLILLGLAGFISMFWMQGYRSAKKSLQDTSAIKDQVVTSLPVGLIATDKDGKIAFYNSAAERITGLDLAQARGKEPDSVLPSHLCGLKESLDLGESINEKEMECEFTENKIVPVSISASEIINEEGQFVGQVLIIRDLGEVRRLQGEIRRKEKLAAIGGLAAGVAHEIRNPLSSIKGIASYYKSKFEDGSEDKEMAGVMIEEVDRLSRVISELLEFARPTKLNKKLSDMNELLKHSTRLVEQEAAAKKVDIQLNLTSDSIEADVDPDRLTQCFLNLFLNALQAMESGGRLTVSSSTGANGNVAIDIKDNGSGISAEGLSKIFDPYFTTKPKGTGLGLAIVHKIIEAHQGQIKVRSTSGQGTVFSIALPLGDSEMRLS